MREDKWVRTDMPRIKQTHLRTNATTWWIQKELKYDKFAAVESFLWSQRAWFDWCQCQDFILCSKYAVHLTKAWEKLPWVCNTLPQRKVGSEHGIGTVWKGECFTHSNSALKRLGYVMLCQSSMLGIMRGCLTGNITIHSCVPIQVALASFGGTIFLTYTLPRFDIQVKDCILGT